MEILNYINLKMLYQKYKWFKGEQLIKNAKSLKEVGKYKKALKMLLNAKRKFDQSFQDDVIFTLLLNNIGDAYFHLTEYSEALNYFKQAEDRIVHTSLEKELEYVIYRNLAMCYKQKRDLTFYINYLNKCLQMEEVPLKKAGILIELSHSHRLLEEFEEALTFGQTARKIYDDHYVKNAYEIGYCLLTISLIYLDSRQFLDAVPLLEQVEEIYSQNKVDNTELLHIYELLEYAFFHLGYKDTAIFYSSKSHKILNPESN